MTSSHSPNHDAVSWQQVPSKEVDVSTPDIPRAVLPIPDRPYSGLTTYDANDPDTSFAPITMLRPPAGAPNVLVVLLDDVVFPARSPGSKSTLPKTSRMPTTSLQQRNGSGS